MARYHLCTCYTMFCVDETFSMLYDWVIGSINEGKWSKHVGRWLALVAITIIATNSLHEL